MIDGFGQNFRMLESRISDLIGLIEMSLLLLGTTLGTVSPFVLGWMFMISISSLPKTGVSSPKKAKISTEDFFYYLEQTVFLNRHEIPSWILLVITTINFVWFFWVFEYFPIFGLWIQENDLNSWGTIIILILVLQLWRCMIVALTLKVLRGFVD